VKLWADEPRCRRGKDEITKDEKLENKKHEVEPQLHQGNAYNSGGAAAEVGIILHGNVRP
jgi:hypothetical protein